MVRCHTFFSDDGPQILVELGIFGKVCTTPEPRSIIGVSVLVPYDNQRPLVLLNSCILTCNVLQYIFNLSLHCIVINLNYFLEERKKTRVSIYGNIRCTNIYQGL